MDDPVRSYLFIVVPGDDIGSFEGSYSSTAVRSLHGFFAIVVAAVIVLTSTDVY